MPIMAYNIVPILHYSTVNQMRMRHQLLFLINQSCVKFIIRHACISFTTCSILIALCGCHSSASRDTLVKTVGVDRINEEASLVFEQFSSSNTVVLSGSDLQKFPAIAQLGDSIIFYQENTGLPAHLSIRYGSHRETSFIFVFAPGKPPVLNNPDHYSQITTNIFISREN